MAHSIDSIATDELIRIIESDDSPPTGLTRKLVFNAIMKRTEERHHNAMNFLRYVSQTLAVLEQVEYGRLSCSASYMQTLSNR